LFFWKMLLWTLEGRMPEGGRYVDFLKKLLPLCYASFRVLQSHERSTSLWLGRRWRSLGILRVTKSLASRGLGYYVGMREENAWLVQDLRMHIMYLFLWCFI
jgi:hypothetical protein